MAYSIRIENIAQIERAFKKSPEKMTKELNKAIMKSMISIQGETILNVHPARGINVITGGLEAATERPPIFTELRGEYDVDINYAVYVHEGTKFMKARPFLKNAIDAKQQEVNDNFKQAVDNVAKSIEKDAR